MQLKKIKVKEVNVPPSVFNEGQSAYYRGKTLNDNPYEVAGTEAEVEVWKFGWRYAEATFDPDMASEA